MPEATIQVSADIARLQEGFEKIREEVKGLKSHVKKEGHGLGRAMLDGIKEAAGELSSLTGLGVAGGILGVFEAVKGAAGSVHNLQLLSEKLGVTVEELQRVGAVAKVTKTDMETVAKSFLKLEASLGDPGNEALAKALKDLGVSASQLAGMTLPEKMLALRDAFDQARASGTGVHDLKELLGKGFADLIPVLSMTREELEGVMNAVKPMGEEFITQMALIDEALERSENKASKWGKKLLGNVAVGLESIVAAYQDLFTGSKDHLTALINEGAEAYAQELDRKDKIKSDRSKSSRNLAQKEKEAEEKKAEKDHHELSQEGGKLDKLKLDGLDDGSKLESLKKELEGIFSEMGRINDTADEDSIMKWAEQMRSEGNTEMLKSALVILERIREIKKETAEIEKKQSEEQKKHDEQLRQSAAAQDRDRDLEEKAMSHKDRVKAIKEDLVKIFNDEGVKNLAELKSKVSNLDKTEPNSEAAKRAHEDYDRALRKREELAKEMSTASVSGRFAQMGNIVEGRSAFAIVADNSARQTELLGKVVGLLGGIEGNTGRPPPTTPATPDPVPRFL